MGVKKTEIAEIDHNSDFAKCLRGEMRWADLNPQDPEYQAWYIMTQNEYWPEPFLRNDYDGD